MPFSIIYFHKIHFPSASGQTIQVIRDYAAMARRGHAVHLFYRAGRPLSIEQTRQCLADYEPDGAPGLKLHFVPDKGLPSRHMEKTAAAIMSGQTGPAVLVTRTLDHAGRAISLARRQKPKPAVVLELHETAIPHMVYMEDGRKIRAWASRIQEKRIFSSVNAILCNAPPQKELLAARFPRLAAMAVLPNSFDAHAFETADAGPKARGFSIRYAGQFSQWKNPEIMVAALAGLPADFILELAGGKPEEEKKTRAMINGWADRHQVTGRVFYHGFLAPARVPGFLKGARCLVLPLGDNVRARYFTSPMKLFEYAASSVPMVAFALPTICGLIQHQKHALLVSPGSAHALADAIRTIRAHPEKAADMALRAKAWVQTHAAAERARKYEMFLEEILLPSNDFRLP